MKVRKQDYFKKKLVLELRKRFRNNLITLLGYGSFFTKTYRKNGDIDLVLILKSKTNQDNQKIRAALRGSSVGEHFQIQVLYKNRILSELAGIVY